MNLAHLDHHYLTGHMVQHLFLTLVAAPLLVFGLRSWLRVYRRPHLAVCWLAGTLTVIFWHVPAVFELALRSPVWHTVEQASFLIGGCMFWWPVLHTGFEAENWSIPMYLFLAALPCDILSAFLAFSDRVVYRHYAAGHRALEDQALAGALMWVTVTFAYLIPALFITAQLLRVRHTSASAP